MLHCVLLIEMTKTFEEPCITHSDTFAFFDNHLLMVKLLLACIASEKKLRW